MYRTLLLLLIIFFHGRTVGNYKSHGLTKGTVTSGQKDCKISYFIEVEGFHKDRSKNELTKYSERAEKIMESLHCKSVRLTEPMQNGLLINVQYGGHGGASPEDFITGLTLGIIPSRTTRNNMYIYSISDGANSKDYSLDQVSYSHFVLFPFIWVNILADSEYDHFGYVLADFIKHKELRNFSELYQ